MAAVDSWVVCVWVRCHNLEACSVAFLDIVFNGGMYGMSVGNQQFTVRNITVNNANTAVHASWNWGQYSILSLWHLYIRMFTFYRMGVSKC